MLDNNMSEEEKKIYNEIVNQKKVSENQFQKVNKRKIKREEMSFYDSLKGYVSDHEFEMILDRYKKFINNKNKSDSNSFNRLLKDGVSREEIVHFLLDENFSQYDADDIADLYIYGKKVVNKGISAELYNEQDVKEIRTTDDEGGGEEFVYRYIEDEDGLEWKIEGDKYVISDEKFLTIEQMYDFIKSNNIIKYDETLYSIIDEYYFPDYNPYVIYAKEIDGKSAIDEELFKNDIESNYDDIKKIIKSTLRDYELSCGKDSIVYKSVVETEKWVDELYAKKNSQN